MQTSEKSFFPKKFEGPRAIQSYGKQFSDIDSCKKVHSECGALPQSIQIGKDALPLLYLLLWGLTELCAYQLWQLRGVWDLVLVTVGDLANMAVPTQ